MDRETETDKNRENRQERGARKSAEDREGHQGQRYQLSKCILLQLRSTERNELYRDRYIYVEMCIGTGRKIREKICQIMREVFKLSIQQYYVGNTLTKMYLALQRCAMKDHSQKGVREKNA